MAKGDHKRSENKADEQQQLAQSYLTGVQSNIGNQYGANNSLYWGGSGPSYGSVNNWGSTIPSYSQFGQTAFPDNNFGTSFPNQGPIQNSYGGGGNQDYEAMINQLFPGDTLSSQQLIANEGQLNQMVMRLLGANSAGMRTKVELPDGRVIDLIGGAGSGGGTGRKQFLTAGGGGGGIGSYGQGGIPGMSLGDYSQISSLYQGMLPQYQNLYGDLRGQFGNFIGSASNMAQTGGLSDADKSNIRARAISPIRSVYSQALQNLNRQKALQGGYSPGYTTALGRFNRDQGQQTSDATTNAEGMIAELVQKGKLGGLSAWGSGLGSESSALLGALGGEQGAIGGMAGLFGTQPGMGKFFADQLQNSMSNQLQAGQLQNQLSLGSMNAQNYIGANVPGNFQSFVDPFGGFIRNVGNGIAGASTPFLS